MITKLRLKNWRSHLNSEFEFTNGVNALLGIMGSGKSSVMDGLCFGLFGTFPLLHQRKIKLDEVIRNKPSKSDRAEIEIEFIGQDGKQYLVQRILERGKGTTTSNLRCNDLLLEGPNAVRCTERIVSLLKIDYEIFSKAIYSDQNKLDYFLEVPKGQRMARIDKLLNIQRFETARKNSTIVLNKINQELETKGDLSNELISDSEIENSNAIIEEKDKLGNEIDIVKTSLDNFNSTFKQIEDEFQIEKEKAKQIEAMQLKIESFSGQILQLKENIQALGVDSSLYVEQQVNIDLKKVIDEIEQFNQNNVKKIELEKKHEHLIGQKQLLDKRIESSIIDIQNLGFGEVTFDDFEAEGQNFESK